MISITIQSLWPCSETQATAQASFSARGGLRVWEGCGLGAPRHWRRGLGPPLAPVGSPRVCTEVWRVRSLVPGPLLASHCPLPSRQQSDLFETGNPLTSLLCKTNVTGFTLPFGGHKPEPHLGALACVAPRFISCPALRDPAPTPRHAVLLSVPRTCKAFLLPSWAASPR